MARLLSLLAGLWAATPRLVPLAGGGLLIWLLVSELRREVIEVAPISVPARLGEQGLTPEVVALRLLDGIAGVQARVRGEPLRRTGAEIAGSQPDFAVPLTGLSLRSVIALLRGLLGIEERRVSGEIVVESDRLSIRLRMSGRGVIVDERADTTDALITRAGPGVWRAAQPQLYAWWLAETATSEAETQAALSTMLEDPEAGPELVRTLRLLLGRSYARTGRAAEALAMNDLLLAEAPSYAPGLYARGRALRELGRLDEAMEMMRVARAMLPQAAFIHVGMAQVLRDQGRDAAALAELAPALLPGRADGQAPTEAALALLALDRVAEALAMARRAAAMDPANPLALSALGAVLLRSGRGGEALEAFDRALGHAPTSPDAWAGRIAALLALGRGDDARAAFADQAAAIRAVPRLRPAAAELARGLGL